jgi:hyaluronan synthase
MNIEYFSTIWQQMIIYIPFGIIGAWRWGVWLWQKIFSFFYRPTRPAEGAFRPSLSIVTPVYNEDPDLFLAALRSWQYNRPDEIIAVIDATDTRCIDVFTRFASEYSGAKLIITGIPGKRPALAEGAAAANGDIVALVDSDTLWDEGVADHALTPFADPEVGGVSTRQTVIAPETIAQRLFAIRLDLRYFQEFPYLSVVGDALTCLSGRTAFYRRTALLPCLPDLISEHFLGQPCISGDDKRLTSLLLAYNWKLRFQQNAVVRTPGMESLFQFFQQNLRWARNSWRTDLKMLASRSAWREPLFAYHLIDRAIQPFTLLLGPIYFGIALTLHHYVIAGILLSWWIVGRTIRILPHLRRAPLDIFMVPLYTAAQYLLAILKIYALFTLNYQSWITRWHTGRMHRWGFFSLLPSRAATIFVIGGIAFGISRYEFSVAEAQALKEEQNAIVYMDDFSSFALDERLGAFEAERAAHQFGSYVTRTGDTPELLGRKYNLSPAATAALFPRRPANTLLLPGQKVSIPIEDLTKSYTTDVASLGAYLLKPLVITFDTTTNTINVKGKGRVVTIPAIAAALNRPFVRQPALLTETAPKEWLLRSNLYISEGVTLVIDQKDVTWLKLKSSSDGFAMLTSYNAGILINRTKITSWDETAGAPDTDYVDGRAHITARANGRMDVLDSEIGWLGYPRSTEITRGKQIGGVYGLSWKIPNGTFGRTLLTGNAIGNRIHDNYFGIYTFGTTGMIIRDNELYDNIQYGIDPHDDSNNLLIENNYAHNNGNHGIIVSKRVVYSTIRNNRSVDNRLHGIMLDRESNYNLVESNIASGNVNGITLYDSHHNLIRLNTLTQNKYGIRANMNSSLNDFRNNSIRNSEKGIFLYGDAHENLIEDNIITGNAAGISLKNATSNYVLDNPAGSSNPIAIKVDGQSRTTNFIRSAR